MAFINHLKVSRRDLDGIPNTILITFSSGDDVSYVRKDGVGENKSEENKSEPTTNRLPQYNFCDFKYLNTISCDLRAQYALCTKTLCKMMNTLRASLEEAGKLREKAKSEVDLQYQTWERNLRSDYSSQKKMWQNLKDELEVSEGRLRLVVKQLREANLEKAPAVIAMLETQGEFFAKSMELMNLKYDTFLSHVQKCSSDLCGRLSDALTHVGITSWYDMYASKLDAHGMIEGVINSKLFTVVLTKDYFKRPYCLFEYCIAVMAGKTILAIYESDQRFEGGLLENFDIPKMFKETIMKHEIIKVDRRQWRSFFSLFERAIKARQNYVNVFTDRDERVRLSSNILQNNLDISFLKGKLHSSGWKFGERIFSSTADGFTVESFHDQCDRKGATLTVAKRKSGIIFGGFVPLSWTGEGGYVDVPEAWMFAIEEQRAPMLFDLELGKVQVFGKKTVGPYFTIKLPSEGVISFGIHGMSDNKHLMKGLFAGNKKAGINKDVKIDEYEVFQILKDDMRASV